MRRLAAYADLISAWPGEIVGFKVSADPGVTTYRADLVRLWCLDDHRDGSGLQSEVVPSAFDGEYPARTQAVRIGSSLQACHPALLGHRAFKLTLS
jgi:hypothetical protein